MVAVKNVSRKIKRQEKANYLFVIYKIMGDERSLRKLFEMCQAVGVKISEKSLQHYSSLYGWQARLLEEATAGRGQAQADLIKTVEKMNKRHADVATGLMSLAVQGISRIQTQIQQAARGEPGASPFEPTVHEIARLFEVSQRGERLARGQSTSRIEVWQSVTETVVKEFALIFMAVNILETPEERREEFMLKSDDMIKRYYNENTEG